jgi:hypothetical protein
MKQTNFLLVFTIASLLITKPVSPIEDGPTLKKAKERNLSKTDSTKPSTEIGNNLKQTTEKEEPNITTDQSIPSTDKNETKDEKFEKIPPTIETDKEIPSTDEKETKIEKVENSKILPTEISKRPEEQILDLKKSELNKTTESYKAENKNSENSTPNKKSDFLKTLIQQFTDKNGCEDVLKNLKAGVNDCSKEYPENKSLTKFICFKESAEEIILDMHRDFFNFEIILKKIYDPIKDSWHVKFPIAEHLSAFCQTESDQIDTKISEIVLEALAKSIENTNKNEKNEFKDLKIDRETKTISFTKSTGDKNTNIDIYKISYTINSEKFPYSVTFASLLFENTLEFTKSDKKFIEDEVDRALPNVIKQCMDSFRLIKSSSEAVTDTHKLKCKDIFQSFESLTIREEQKVQPTRSGDKNWELKFSCPARKKKDNEAEDIIKFHITCHENELVDTMLNYNLLILKEEGQKTIFEISLLQESFSDMEVHALRFKRSTEEFLRYACPLGIQSAAKEI